MYQGGVRWEGSDLQGSSGWRGGSEVGRVSSSPSLGVWVCRVGGGGGDGSKALGLHFLRYKLEMGMFGRISWGKKTHLFLDTEGVGKP